MVQSYTDCLKLIPASILYKSTAGRYLRRMLTGMGIDNNLPLSRVDIFKLKGNVLV